MKICQGRLCAATLDQVGAAALYRGMTPDYLRSVRDEYGRRKDALVSALSKLPGVTHSSPEGAFYVMATLPVDDAEKLQYFLLQEFEDHGETVMYAPGEGFYGTPGKGKNEVRIAYVTQPKELTRAIESLHDSSYRHVEIPSRHRGGAGAVSKRSPGPSRRGTPAPPERGGPERRGRELRRRAG